MPGVRHESHEARGDMWPMARHVFYADGGKDGTGVVQAAFRQLELSVRQFESVEQCLACLGTQECHLVVSNAQRPATEGMRLLAAARHIKPTVPIIMLVDQGDIQVAVDAVKRGASDCLERPPEKARLISAIGSVLQESHGGSLPRENPLSKTETTVLHLILQGKTTAEIARILNRSRRTIEVHRRHIMRKLGTDGMVDLVRTCFRMGLLENWP